MRRSLLAAEQGELRCGREWDSFQNLAVARPKMIAMLDTFRDTPEDLGGGLGVTDPVSGEVVLEI